MELGRSEVIILNSGKHYAVPYVIKRQFGFIEDIFEADALVDEHPRNSHVISVLNSQCEAWIDFCDVEQKS